MIAIKKVIMKWNPANKKWYESKGYIFTKYGDEFEVKIEDISDGSHIFVDINCDNCGILNKNIVWKNYKKSLHNNDGKYYCKNCISQERIDDRLKTMLAKSISFYQWCYNNLPKDIADKIMLRWDYERNIKNGKVLSPKDVGYKSNGIIKNKGYWFKCLDHPEHGSELKNISSFTKGRKGSIECNKCNTISITHPNLVKYLVNKEDAFKYSYGTGEKLLLKCPHCGFIKKMLLTTVINQGFGCPKCSDGIPYTEKFMYNVFEQLLNKDFETQLSKKTFEWCGGYRYDTYINKINGICECHGIQHYEETGGKWGSLDKTQENDFDKEWLAKLNNIKNYIIIDCRKSELEWIKNSIMNSRLPILLNFKVDDIDWLKCHKAGCKNMVKVACDLWYSGIKNSTKIMEELKLGRGAVVKYLKQGNELGWCDYNVEEEKKKRDILHVEVTSIKVVCLTTEEVFNSQAEAGNNYNIAGTNISRCCRKKANYAGEHPETGELLMWMFYDEYLIKNKILGWRENYIKSHDKRNKKIICLTTEEIFNSQNEANIKYNIKNGKIIECCTNKRNSAGKHPETKEMLLWMFYDEYLIKNQTVGWRDTFINNHLNHASNIHIGNKSRTGLHHSEETKIKMSKAQRGRIFSEETKQKMSNSAKIKIFSKQHRINMSNSTKGKPKSIKTIQKMKEARKSFIKINSEQAEEIRKKYATGKFKQQELAEEYFVSMSVISTVIGFRGAYKRLA